jgi:(4-(4-[2-(gamma-L-glutamylamino)ethyl]phenoxymethyl)furan-2-yl)methanamine synthase
MYAVDVIMRAEARGMSVIVGWDIGGAHLKAARAENARIVDAVQLACPLRLGLEAVAGAFPQATARIGGADRHVVTMTGELADTFASRREGVERLSALAVRALAPAPVWLYAGRAGFISPAAAHRHVEDVASANWLASASVAAKAHDAALFMDIGSTTTDIVPVAGGAVKARGYTDAQRLAAGELVYTGLVRSFVMAVAERAPLAGRWVPLINENFATMADVHRILGTLPEGADQMATADRREKTVAASLARLARMVGCDAGDADAAAWTALARWFAEAQVRSIIDGAMLVLSAARLSDAAPIIGAGVGAGMASAAAQRLGRGYVEFASLLDVVPQARERASHCAPAAALAILANGERANS